MKPEMIIPTYGADMSGMVCAFRFTPDTAGVPVDASETQAGLRQAPEAGVARRDFQWLHFNLAHGASERWMRAHLDLPETYFEFLREGSHSTRIEQPKS